MPDQDLLAKIDRRSLYEMVWCRPIIHLAPELGLSTARLAGYCRSLAIPLPPRMYWLRYYAGPPVQRYPLPYPHEHTLVVRTRMALKRSAAEDTRKILAARRATYLDFRVTKRTWIRSLKIMDSLIKLLEGRGHAVSIVNERKHWTRVQVQDTVFPLSIAERVHTVNEHYKRACRNAPERPLLYPPAESLATGILTITTRRPWPVPPSDDGFDAFLLSIVTDLETFAEGAAKQAKEAKEREVAAAKAALQRRNEALGIAEAVQAMEQTIASLPSEYHGALLNHLKGVLDAASRVQPPSRGRFEPVYREEVPGWAWNLIRRGQG